MKSAPAGDCCSKFADCSDDKRPRFRASSIVNAVLLRVDDVTRLAFKELVPFFPRQGLRARWRLDRSAPESADGIPLRVVSVRGMALVFWAEPVAVDDLADNLDGDGR